MPGSEGKRGGRESCSRAVFVLVVPKQHGGTRGPPFEIICWESVVKEEFLPPFLYRAIHRNLCICPDSTHLPKCNEQTSGEGKSPRRRTCADCGSHTPCCSAAWLGRKWEYGRRTWARVCGGGISQISTHININRGRHSWPTGYRMRGERKSRHSQSYHTAGLVRLPKIGHLCCGVIRLLSRQMARFFVAQKLSMERATWSVIEQASERALLTTNDHFIIVYCSALTLVREKITTRKEVSRRSAHSLSSTSLSHN